MRLSVALCGAILASVAGAVALQSCGGDSNSSSGNSTENPTIEDDFTLTITDATVAIPAGAFAAGVKVKLETAEPPALFEAQADPRPVTDVVAELKAETSAGVVVEQATKDLTITFKAKSLPVSDGELTRMDELCVFALSPSGKGYVWRTPALSSVSADGVVVITTRQLGIFQLYLCGTTPVSGFTEVQK